MSATLRVQLGKSLVESQEHSVEAEGSDDSNWPYDTWAEAVNAFNGDHELSNPRFPIIINGEESVLDSAETLQKIARLPTTPSIRTTTMADSNGNDLGVRVQIADIGWDEVKLLKARTWFEEKFVLFSAAPDERPAPTPAVLVSSMKLKWERRPWVPWAPKKWGAIMKAHSMSGQHAVARWPIVVGGLAEQGPINGPESLQKLLGLTHVPLVTTTRLTRRSGDWSGNEVQVVEITGSEWDLLYRLVIMENCRVWFPNALLHTILPRVGYVVKSIRETPIEKNADKWKYWSEAVAAAGRGEVRPEIRVPIIISMPEEDNPLTVERLRKLAELPSTPTAVTREITNSGVGLDGAEALVVDISVQESLLLEDRTECDHSEYILFPDEKTGELKVRTVTIVKKIKDKWLDSLEWEERLERGEDRGDDMSDLSG